MSKQVRCRVTFRPKYKIGDKFKFTNAVTKKVNFYVIVCVDYSTCTYDFEFNEQCQSIEYWFKVYAYKGDESQRDEFVITDDALVDGTLRRLNCTLTYEKVTDGYINKFIKQLKKGIIV